MPQDPKEAHISGVREISTYDPQAKPTEELCIFVRLAHENHYCITSRGNNSLRSTEARAIMIFEVS